ncbi:MAG: CRISPR-associated endonuclease Cas1 [Gemmatimonadales bacterium]|nr:CRISPR-associated endonuclease Cas1 [Gemmatimonadales bacterium]
MLRDDAAPPSEEAGVELLPVRMLNEFAYCPRLFYLMHVEGRWEDNEFTLEGREAHRRVDRTDQLLPDPDHTEGASDDGDDEPVVVRSVSLGSLGLGLTAKLDLVEAAGDAAVPVDTKRGRVPQNPDRSWEPERVQLMAQGLLLREHGYRCDTGILYFAGSRSRVTIPLTASLEQRTHELIQQAREVARTRAIPPPLDDSPKCNGCSLAGICLPDETLALKRPDASSARSGGSDESSEAEGVAVRRFFPPRVHAMPLYIQEQGARVGKRGERLIISKENVVLSEARLKDISQVVLMGNVSVTAQCLHLLCESGIPVVHLSTGHWFYGTTTGITLRNAYDRAAQYAAAGDPVRALTLAKAIVLGKGLNQRTLLGRNVRPRPVLTLKEMSMYLSRVPSAATRDELLGLEGATAAKYFSRFAELLRPRDFEAELDFEGRNRRPPTDPVNALLSFGYAVLVKECTVALLAEGLDPWWGIYHQPRHGRPALALDLMEEFRPLIVDSSVISAINTGMVTGKSFQRTAAACALTPQGRKNYLRAYEGRMDELVTHPVFEYRCSWRTVVRLQARLLARWLRGDIPDYVPIRTR